MNVFVRIDKLAQKGFVSRLTADDLPPEQLRLKIKQALAQKYPPHSIAIDGARQISEQIKSILKQH